MSQTHPQQHVYLIRHGETAWSLNGRHTGSTDIPLTENGVAQARRLGESLSMLSFSTVMTSPLSRALQTCRYADVQPAAKVDADLREWNYGDYEGRTTAEIVAASPGWNLFADGAPGGESVAQVQARADRVIRSVKAVPGSVAIFSHGHFLRVLATRWILLPAEQGARLILSPCSISILGYEHDRLEEPAIILWNRAPTLPD